MYHDKVKHNGCYEITNSWWGWFAFFCFVGHLGNLIVHSGIMERFEVVYKLDICGGFQLCGIFRTR